jgi:NitT/TauT family transport system substrate-binding protein
MVRSATIMVLGVAMASVLATQVHAQALKTWKHAILEPKSDAGFILMAGQHDFAKKQGIDLQFITVKDETLALRALLAGDIDSYEGTPPFSAVAGGAEAKVVGCYWVGLPHAVFARDSLASMKDLAGKSIASSAPNSLPDLIAHATLDHFGVPAASVQFASVGSDADRFRALATGVVDAAVVAGEYAPIAAAQKIKIVAAARDMLPDFTRLCYVMSDRDIKGRANDAAHFLATEIDALNYALSHRDEAIELTQQKTGLAADDPRPAYVFDDTVKTKAIDTTLPIPVGRITAMQTILHNVGVVPKTVDISSMIEPSLREKALQLAGR